MKVVKKTIEFIPAKQEDASALRALAHQSEAHWGYDEAFMKTFDKNFNITEQFISDNPVYVSWIDSNPVAFWGIIPCLDGWELEYFYIDVSALCHGLSLIHISEPTRPY